jgi:hypothetical protein
LRTKFKLQEPAVRATKLALCTKYVARRGLGFCTSLCYEDLRSECKALRYRVWVNGVLKLLCAVVEGLIVRFYDQVSSGKAIKSFGIESKLAPSF